MLQPEHIKALQLAVADAGDLRGMLTGNPNGLLLEEFDRRMALAREALVLLAQMQKRAQRYSNLKESD